MRTMITLITRLFVKPQNAPRCPQTAESHCPRDRALEELMWLAEFAEFEQMREERQRAIDTALAMAEMERQAVEAKRQWSQRMHRAKLAKRLAKKAA